MIATPTRSYLADDKSCKLLDAATGAGAGRDHRAGRSDRRHVLEVDGPGRRRALRPGGRARAPDPDATLAAHGPRLALERHLEGLQCQRPAIRYATWGFRPEIMRGVSRSLLAIDPEDQASPLDRTGKTLPIDSRALCMNGGRIYFSHFGRYLACLDAKTAREIWRRTAEKDPEVFEAIGPYRPPRAIGRLEEHTSTCKCTDKALYLRRPAGLAVTALSAADGRHLWTYRAARTLHIVIRDDGLYTIGPGRLNDDTKKLDPLTGKVLASYNIAPALLHPGDGQLRQHLLPRREAIGPVRPGQRQPPAVDLADAPLVPRRALVADGHLYWVPWACDCNLQLFGVIGCGPAGDFEFDQKADATAASRPLAMRRPRSRRLPRSPADWPTYRADNAATARNARSTIPESVRLLWTFTPESAFEPTAPVAAGGWSS